MVGSVTVVLRLLGSAKARLGTSVGPLEFSEPLHRRGQRAVQAFAPVEVIAVALVASLGQQIFDPRRVVDHSPCFRASRSRSRAICPGSIRLRNSPMFSSSRIACR